MRYKFPIESQFHTPAEKSQEVARMSAYEKVNLYQKNLWK